jgi:hypothetical protein
LTPLACSHCPILQGQRSCPSIPDARDRLDSKPSLAFHTTPSPLYDITITSVLVILIVGSTSNILLPTTMQPRADGAMNALAWYRTREVRLIDVPIPDITACPCDSRSDGDDGLRVGSAPDVVSYSKVHCYRGGRSMVCVTRLVTSWIKRGLVRGRNLNKNVKTR